MKHFILIVSTLFFSVNIYSQKKVGKFEMNVGMVTPLGNFASQDANNPYAYFANFGTSFDITLKRYSKKGIGFGFRIAIAEIYPESSMLSKRLMSELGSQDYAQYGLNTFSISSSSFQLALSYNYTIGRFISIEPYINGGMEILSIPEIELHYLKENATHYFRQDEYLSNGFSINPGLAINFTLGSTLGLQVFGSYSTAFLEDYKVHQLAVGPTTIDNYEKDLSAKPEYYMFGIGLTMNLSRKKTTE